MGRARATHTDELSSHAPSKRRGDPKHDDAGSADMTSDPSHVRESPGAGRVRANRERVCGGAPGRIPSGVPSRQGGIATGGITSEA